MAERKKHTFLGYSISYRILAVYLNMNVANHFYVSIFVLDSYFQVRPHLVRTSIPLFYKYANSIKHKTLQFQIFIYAYNYGFVSECKQKILLRNNKDKHCEHSLKLKHQLKYTKSYIVLYTNF
jgi:hypothetical protein